MTHDNEFLTRCFAAYWGAEVTMSDQDVNFKVNSIFFPAISQLELCKLLLTPLSAISDEDAIEVAKIMLDKPKDWTPVEIIRWDWTTKIITNIVQDTTNSETEITMAVRVDHDGGIKWQWEYKKGSNTGIGDKGVPEINHVIDYLRSKGYDCGYAHLGSLIEAGIALIK